MSCFDVHMVSTLPPMAWLYRMPRHGRPELYHGKSVEVFPDGFFEGCFAGSWLTDNVTHCPEVFGSGLKMKDGIHHFVTPSHTLEALFTLSRSDELAVSNSLCFLLEFYAVTLPLDLRFCQKLVSTILGIDAYEQYLSKTPRGNISRVIYDNVTIAQDLRIRHNRKPLGPPFTNYGLYVQYLTDVLKAAFANACDSRRQVQFSPLSTCSTGYDSAAGAAIAKRLGCLTAVTVKTGRGGVVDSGRPVGEALGLEVSEVEQAQSVESFQDCAEFLAMGLGGEDYCFRHFAPLIDARILLTGFHGDKMWDLHAKPNSVLARGDLSGSSLQEFRLNRNFINIPVPTIGARRHSDVVGISQKEEMIPYRLYNDYDRPIPRRLLEESGVARELFGQGKTAASVDFFCDPRLIPPIVREAEKKLVPLSAASCAQLLLHRIFWLSRWFLYRLSNKAGSIFRPIGGLSTWIVSDWWFFMRQDPQLVLGFLSGLAMTRRRYSIAVNTCGDHQIREYPVQAEPRQADLPKCADAS